MSQQKRELTKTALDVKKLLAEIPDASLMNTRWAYTALDAKFKDHAVPDEILIDKETGQFFYKRVDGKIVSYVPPTSNVSANSVLITEINSAIVGIMNGGGVNVRFPDDKNSLLLSFTLPLEGRTTTQEIIAGITNIQRAKFKVSPLSNSFFAKVNSRPEDMNYIELLTAHYNKTAEVSTFTNARLDYSVKYTDGHQNSVTKDYRQEFKLNKLEVFPFVSRLDNMNDPIFDTLTGDVVDIEVEIKGISSEKLSTAYSPSHSEEEPFSTVIAPDGKIIITDINLLPFISNMNDIPKYEDMIINLIMSAQQTADETKKSGGMTEEEKKELEDLKKEVASLPRMFISQEPVDGSQMKNSDLWIQLTTPIPTYQNVINVTGTNITFIKEELEKYLIEDVELIRSFTLDESETDSIFIDLEDKKPKES